MRTVVSPREGAASGCARAGTAASATADASTDSIRRGEGRNRIGRTGVDGVNRPQSDGES